MGQVYYKATSSFDVYIHIGWWITVHVDWQEPFVLHSINPLAGIQLFSALHACRPLHRAACPDSR